LWNADGTFANYEFNGSKQVPDQAAYSDVIVGNDAVMVLPQTTTLGYLSVPMADFNDAVDPNDDNFYVRIDFAPTTAPTDVKVKYFAVKEPLDQNHNLPLTFEAGRNYTFVVDLSADEQGIGFATVVSNFDNAFPDVDMTQPVDPDPAEDEDYVPEPHKGFAGSNIYWDGTQLTFADIDYDPTTDPANAGLNPGDPGYVDKSQYSGLYFKWGSLVGISPKDAFAVATTPIYVPAATVGAHKKTTFPAIYGGSAAWTSIVYAAGSRNFTTTPINGINVTASGYITHLNSDPANIAAYLGDICAYLSGRPGIPAGHWRMPTTAEFGVAASYSAENVSGGSFIWFGNSAKDDGTDEIPNGYTYEYAPGKTTFFPAAGNRRYFQPGDLNGFASSGGLWSASPNAGGGDTMYFIAAQVVPNSGSNRGGAFPVRCVKK
jgi:hypothetical protein